ncbi:MAG: XRE family transcriptional regulator [Bacteroides sp.]|nr:XRE family transcriptional regulator [Bacteroides sp.]
MEQKKKSKFRQIYDLLPSKAEVAPKTAWIKEIAAICKVHEVTVRCWLAGTQKPDALKTSIIAEHLGVPENELFN